MRTMPSSTVRCAPVGTRTVEADVVDTIPQADTRGPWNLLVVEYGGHRYRVPEAEASPA